ncbi:hypothetical protein [Sabulicella glaciei]|uniref:Uncharacterized protein n=1 Tax=Sabulicella glaciei TaxID=2984948 RepID=A0ABT3P1Q2_9PROT|nr:hypothetical protein [Roseococcus sp. MDT2-1-1]MCW8088340.1 hypothetical protein [Roseococcus sp. MDT2-1-1]
MTAEERAAARGRLLTAASRRIPRASAASQARALGLWRGNEVVFRNEAQFQLVLDLGVFNPVGEHGSALERETRLPHEDPAEAEVLAALQGARFALFRVEGRHPEGGVAATDVASGEALRIEDTSLEKEMCFGVGFAGRLMTVGGAQMTCGALAPISDEVVEALLGKPTRILPPPTEALPALSPVAEEDAAALRAMAAQPDFAVRVWRAVLDHNLLGPRPH